MTAALYYASRMNTPDEFSRYYAELLEGAYDCADRILRGDDSELDDAHLREMAVTFSRRVHGFCAKHRIAIIDAQAGERKHELAEPYLPADPKFCGLFLVITGNAPAPVWEVKRNANQRIIDVRHRKHWPYVKHYYFHLMDRHRGHVTIRICGYQ